jgi:hypothetical protein
VKTKRLPSGTRRGNARFLYIPYMAFSMLKLNSLWAFPEFA